MKKFVALPLILLLFGATAALAQTGTTSPVWVFGANVGYSLPTGDFGDAYNGGLTAGLTGCYMFNDKYGLEGEMDWSKFGATDLLKESLEALNPGKTADANFTFMPVTVDFVAHFPINAKVTPYLKGGLGIYFESAEIEIAGHKETDTQNDFGFNLGGGVKIPLMSTTTLDLGARFHNVMTEDESTRYFTIGAGIGFIF